MKDLTNRIEAVLALAPGTVTAETVSEAIDMSGAESLAVVAVVGTPGDTLSDSTYFTLALQHSDDNAAYEAVPPELMLGELGVFKGAEAGVMQAGYLGGKRYVKAVITPTGTMANGTDFSVVGIKGELHLQ